MATYSYEVHPRPAVLGGGWKLKLLKDGVEVGGGVFPPEAGASDLQAALDAAHADAMDTGEEWIAAWTSELPGHGNAG
jgi:hypothetical protein